MPAGDARQPGTGLSGERAAPSAAPSAVAEGDLVDVERQIVKTGEVTIEVPKVAEALARVRAMALQLGGYVGGSQAGTSDASATLTLRIPAARFEDALTALHELDGKVLIEATREEDVTLSIVDLKARITNLQSSEAQYRALLGKADKIQDILDVQARLDQVRGEIEQLSGQLKSVSGQADLATLTVTLTPKEMPVQQASTQWDPGATAAQALAALVEIGQGLGSVAIWFVIVWLPILLVLAIMALVVLRGLVGVRRRMPAAPPGEPPLG
ncbi:MAG TPA: DUF4349 domain-containing protein [Candidatus Limnocylindria bacterium]|nr:DUF4349 domain-containing protein [Candidatus Limnocylindria bacterium]